MSNRFNRNDANVPDDRLFPTDFQVDQNGQDGDLLQVPKDFGCLPCLGSGLDVTSKSQPDHKVEVTIGWAYDLDGHRITLESAQEVVLTDTAGGNNYVILTHQYVTSDNRNAHRTGVNYPTRKADGFVLAVQSGAPGINDICLANCKQTGTGAITIEVTERLARSCKLIPHSSIPEVAESEGTGTGADTPPPGQQTELPDYPKGRGVSLKVPMPIILQGTRDGAAWAGIETILTEELGRTTAAVTAMTLERVNLKSGTPLADVKIWVGDWGVGQRDAVDLKKCNFTMPTKSGVSAWDNDLWISDPPGFYYLVKDDESWFSKITDSGSNWVICADDLPDASSGSYHICPYAERYRVEATPYQTDAVVADVEGIGQVIHPRRSSPASPVVRVRELNIGGKYKLQVASQVSNENFTKYAEADFIVGSDLVVCWYPSAPNLNVAPVDGGVEIAIPAPTGGTDDPEAYEICYTYGTDASPDPVEPDFTNAEHPTIRPKERKVKIDAPPGRKVRVKCRAIRTRTVMRCSGLDKVLEGADTYVLAGGISLRRNRKIVSGPINETALATMTAVLVDELSLPNPVWPEKIRLFNPTASSQTDFEVYVHGCNQPYADGRKIEIGTGGDQANIGARSSAEITISDYRILDPAMSVTVKNISGSNKDIELRYTVQYKEDSDSEVA